ncbi:MAG: 50S ribosomal protein L13 [SAR202 cluster bacterium]|nr:50S ribosomal protein L13 [SAR202 cluster bacterium]
MATNIHPHWTRVSDVKAAWHVVDASGKNLGRLSTEIATLLTGKNKPSYVPYLNTGDFVVVINAEKIQVTGAKLDKKVYYRHSGFHGGLKTQTLAELHTKYPARVLKHSIKGMLPKNAVGKNMLSRVKIYTGSEHPHAAQVNASNKAAQPSETPATASAS